jgi:hypothetical protein
MRYDQVARFNSGLAYQPRATVMPPTRLQEHIRVTYFSLRVGLGLLALVFPVLLASYGYFIEHIPIQKSMSAYYFAFAPDDSPLRVFPVRGFFVGILWAIGCFLILYRGFSNTENWLLNLAGVSAISVASFPMEASCGNCASVDLSSVHYSAAACLFILIAFVAWFCNEDSLRELMKEQIRTENALKEELDELQGEDQKKEELKTKLRDLQREHKRNNPNHFRLAYYSLGALMILAPAAAVGMIYFTGFYDWKTFVVEWAGIWVFSAYWLLKSYELSLSRADEKATMGEMTITEPTAKVSEAMRQIRNGVSAKIASPRRIGSGSAGSRSRRAAT